MRGEPPLDGSDTAGGPPSGGGDADPTAGRAARLLVAEHGFDAQGVALLRAADGLGDETSARWLSIAAAVGVLSRASLHMELALSMLDEVGEDAASIRLDHAIETLGVRAAARRVEDGPKTGDGT